MKRYIVTPAVVLALCFSAGAVWAVGTPVNTEIRNQATANYFINSNPLSSSSATVYTYVAEVIDVTVIWQDAPVLNVFSGDNDQALAFLVTNTGNGNETFDLSASAPLAQGKGTSDVVRRALDRAGPARHRDHDRDAHRHLQHQPHRTRVHGGRHAVCQ